MDLSPEPKPRIETKSTEESSDNFIKNALSAFIENDEIAGFSSGNEEPESQHLENKDEGKFYSEAESKMDLSPEPKVRIETKSTEESSDNFIKNPLSAFIENDEIAVFSSGNEEPESQHLENKDEGKFYSEAESNLLEQCDSESQENQNKMDVTKSDDKNDRETKYVENNLEEKETLEIENDFQHQINHQDDVSGEGSNASSSDFSSGIEKDFESLEDCDGVITENEGELDNIFEDSSANPFRNTDSNLVKDPSIKREAEVLENSVCQGKEQDNLNLINNEHNFLKKDEAAVTACNSAPTFDTIKFPYKDPTNAFKVVVPLIGKNVMAFGDLKPFNQRYDLAIEINRLKGLEDAPFMPKLSYHEWRKQRDARSQEEKDREEKKEKYIAVKTAVYIIKISINILQEMKKDNSDENTIERWFLRFLQLPASPLSLLLSSQFVHVMMYIRGSLEFSQRIRYVADRCYLKCHVMFPIPEGYNFETVYTSEVVKNIPQRLNGMHNFVLDYGDFEYPVSESEDSAFSDSDYNET